MTIVADADTTRVLNISVEVSDIKDNVKITQGVSGFYIHKDIWGELKKTVDQTIKEMEATPLTRPEDSNKVLRILQELGVQPGLGGRIQKALQKGYV